MKRRPIAIAIVSLLAGCVSHRPAPDRYSLLEPTEPDIKLHATIAIPNLTAPSWLRTEALVYQLDYEAAPRPIPYAEK